MSAETPEEFWYKNLAKYSNPPEPEHPFPSNVILLELDFPRKKQVPDAIREQNYGMQKAFAVTGYPTIWVFNLTKSDSGQFNIDAIGKTGYVAGGPAKFQEGVDTMIKQYKEKK